MTFPPADPIAVSADGRRATTVAPRAATASNGTEHGGATVAVVTVVHGQSDTELHHFVRQVDALDDGPFALWLVDSGAARPPGLPPALATVVDAGGNVGWTGGANLGARAARELGADHILFLNTDVEILDRCLVRRLLAVLDANPQVALVSPAIVLGDPDRPGCPDAAGQWRTWYQGASMSSTTWITRHPGITRPYRGSGRVRTVGVASGCCLLARGDAFASIGGFDEDLFAYFDEADLCLRMAQAGWTSALLDVPLVAHHTPGRDLTAVSAYYFGRNPWLLARKHLSPGHRVVACAAQLGAAPVYLWRSRGGAARRAFLRGLVHGAQHVCGRDRVGLGHR